MFCKNCGRELEGPALRCPFCDTELAAQDAQPQQQTAAQAQSAPPPGLTKKEFYQRFSKKRSIILPAAILCYICAGATFAVGMLSYIGLWILLDVVLLVGFGLGIQLLRSRVFALALLAYALFNIVYILVVSGAFTGWLVLLAGILAVVGVFGFAKEWKAYCSAPPAGQTGV